MADPLELGPSPGEPSAIEERVANLEANCRSTAHAAQRALVLIENVRQRLDGMEARIPAGSDLSRLRSSVQAIEAKIERLVVDGRTDVAGFVAHTHGVQLPVVDRNVLEGS